MSKCKNNIDDIISEIHKINKEKNIISSPKKLILFTEKSLDQYFL